MVAAGRGRGHVAARVVAPLAFLAAATVAVLLARSVLVGPADPVPPASARTAPAATAAATVTPPPAATETTTAPAPAATYHVVRAGETLAVIAEEYGTTVEAIVALNPGIDPVALAIGQRVRVG